MATQRLTLVNEKGGTRSITPEAWKKLPKGKDGTYNGWRLHGEPYIAKPIQKGAKVDNSNSVSAAPPFIPEEVRKMRDEEMKAKDKEIEELKAMLAKGNEAKEEVKTEKAGLDTSKKIETIEALDPSGKAISSKNEQPKKSNAKK